MALPAEGTLLVISGMGVPLYSARGLTQTLTPIQAASVIRRTINMEVRDLSIAAAKKYDTTISAQDVAPPSVDNFWPGLVVTINCVAQLTRPVGSPAGRPVVVGSEVIEGNFIRYRPQLTMMFVGFSMEEQEWTRGVSWSMTFTET